MYLHMYNYNNNVPFSYCMYVVCSMYSTRIIHIIVLYEYSDISTCTVLRVSLRVPGRKRKTTPCIVVTIATTSNIIIIILVVARLVENLQNLILNVVMQ